MLKTKSVFLLFSITLSAFCYSQNHKQTPKPKASTKTKAVQHVNPNNSLLWEVSGRGLTAPSYLYGTMHIVCAEDARMSDGLRDAIKKAQQVFFEVDMDNMD